MMEEVVQRPRRVKRIRLANEPETWGLSSLAYPADPAHPAYLADPAPEMTCRDKLVYYTAVFLQVALWVAIAWVLSHLHMGAPCFVVVLLLWVYAVPLKAFFTRAKAKVCPFSRARAKQGEP